MFRISESDSLHTNPPTMRAHEGRLTFRLLFAVMSVSIGCWFAFGYIFASTNAPQNVMLQWIRSVKCGRLMRGVENDTKNANDSYVELWCSYIPDGEESRSLAQNPELNTIWGLSGCAFAAGAFFSGWFSNTFVYKMGNKYTLLWTNIFAVAGATLNGMCVILDSHEALIAARFLLGVYGGFCIAVVPAYIAEISPPNLRGLLGTIPGLLMVIGGLIGVLMGIPQVFGTADLWPWVFWLRLVPAIYLVLTLPFCPESPRYLLLIKRRKTDAKEALVWLRGTEDVTDELKMIQAEEASQASQETVSVFGLFKDPFLRKTTYIVIVLLLSQQLSGVAGIALYSTSIFESAGLSGQNALLGTIGIMLAQIVAVLLTTVLMERAGRKALMLIGIIGSMLCLIGMVTFMTLVKWEVCLPCRYGTVAVLIGFMLIFNVGPGFVPWVLVSEMFGQTSRGAAMMVASGVCNGTGILMAFIFPVLQAWIDQWSFAIFAGAMLASALYLAVKLFETKGKEIGEIQTELRRKLM